jgi:hypothetical protein
MVEPIAIRPSFTYVKNSVDGQVVMMEVKEGWMEVVMMEVVMMEGGG